MYRQYRRGRSKIIFPHLNLLILLYSFPHHHHRQTYSYTYIPSTTTTTFVSSKMSGAKCFYTEETIEFHYKSYPTLSLSRFHQSKGHSFIEEFSF